MDWNMDELINRWKYGNMDELIDRWKYGWTNW